MDTVPDPHFATALGSGRHRQLEPIDSRCYPDERRFELARSTRPIGGSQSDALAPRRVPTQRRSRETVSLILDTTAELLDEVGVDAFTTNLLAERAGVRVSTVYRYFPNKLAVIVALAERLAEEWDEWFEGWEPLVDPERDLLEGYELLLDRWVNRIQKQPGGMAIRRAMQAVPELRDVERRDNDGLAKSFSRVLRKRGVRVPPKRLQTVGRMLLDTAAAVADEMLIRGDVTGRASYEELKQMHRAYLSRILS
jgi:AcrR family transcriptional regulator